MAKILRRLERIVVCVNRTKLKPQMNTDEHRSAPPGRKSFPDCEGFRSLFHRGDAEFAENSVFWFVSLRPLRLCGEIFLIPALLLRVHLCSSVASFILLDFRSSTLQIAWYIETVC